MNAIVLLTAIACVGLVSTVLVPCSDTNLPMNDGCLSVAFEFANCPSLTLLNIPTCNVTLTIVNSTVTMWTFTTIAVGATSLSNVAVSLEGSTILHGLVVFPYDLVQTVWNFSLKLAECDVKLNCSQFTTATQPRLVDFRGGQLETFSWFTLHVHRTNVVLMTSVTATNKDANMGLIAFNTQSILTEVVVALSNIDVLIVDTTVTSRWVGIDSVLSSAPYDVATYLVYVTGGPMDSLRGVSVQAVRCAFSGQGSTEATFFFVESVTSTTGLDVFIANCSFDFVVSGPTSSNADYRRSFVVSVNSPMDPSRITISNTVMRSRIIAGVAGELWNMSSVRTAKSSLASVALGNESTIQIFIYNCTCDVTITRGMFVPLAGSIHAAIVSVSTLGDSSNAQSNHLHTEGLQLTVTMSQLLFTMGAPICPVSRTFAVRTQGETVMTLQLSGIAVTVSTSLCILFTPVLNASIAVESSLVRASIPDASQCAAVSIVAVLTPYANGAPQTFLQRTTIIGTAHVSSVASVLFVDEAALGALTAAEVLNDPLLLTMVVSPGTPLSTVTNVDVSLCNCSLYSDESRVPRFRANTKLNSRAIVIVASAEMSDSTVTVRNALPPLLVAFDGSLKRCVAEFSQVASKTPASSLLGQCLPAPVGLASTVVPLEAAAMDTTVLSNLNWLTLSNLSLNSVRFNVSQVGPLSYSNASGALITVVNSSIEVGSVLWGVSHAVVESVPPSFLLMDATGNNTYSSDAGTSSGHSATVVALSCVTWNGVPAGPSLVRGLPSTSNSFVLEGRSDCPPIRSSGFSNVIRSHLGAVAYASSFALLSFGSATSVRTPTALLSSVAIRFSSSGGRCDEVTFADASDGNYFSLALGSEVPYYRGTVVGALIVMSGAMVLSAGLAAVMKAYLHVSWRAVLGALMLPSSLYIVLQWALLPGVGASVALIGGGSRNPMDIVIVVLWALSGLGALGVIVVGPSLFALSEGQLVRARRAPSHRGWWRRAVCLVDQRSVAWRNRVAGSMFVERYGGVFEMYREGRHWFAVVEVTTTVLFGIIQGASALSGEDDEGRCAVAMTLFGATEMLSLVVLAALRPYDALIDSLAAFPLSLLGGVHGLLLTLRGACTSSACSSAATGVAEAQLYLSIALPIAQFVFSLGMVASHLSVRAHPSSVVLALWSHFLTHVTTPSLAVKVGYRQVSSISSLDNLAVIIYAICKATSRGKRETPRFE